MNDTPQAILRQDLMNMLSIEPHSDESLAQVREYAQSLLIADNDNVHCVFCEDVCDHAPTERGWMKLRYGQGLHFECAIHAGEVARARKRTDNKMEVANKPTHEETKDV